MLQNNCNSIIHLADLADAHVILARHFGMESCAKRAVLETANSENTACGSRYDYTGDEDLVQLKECTRDAKAHLASFFFPQKNRRSSISVRYFKLP